MIVATALIALLPDPQAAPDPRAAAPRQLRAVPATSPPRLDGVLDEVDWQRAPALDGFVQREPHDGEPSTEGTVVRVLFGGAAIYFGATVLDSQPDQITAPLHGRDVWRLTGLWDSAGPDDSLAILLDTFGDKRNGYYPA